MTKESAYRLGGRSAATPLRAGITVHKKPYDERAFVTAQYAVVYVASGSGVYIRGHERSPISAGTVFQRFPGIAHHDAMHTPSKRYFIAVPAEGYELLRLTNALITAPVFTVRMKDISRRFEAVIDALDRSPDSHLSYTLFDMLAFIADIHASARSLERALPIDRAFAMLAREHDAQVPLPDIAERLGMNYHTFRKRFTAQAGISPEEYRIRKRIERAMVLLSQGEAVASAAARLGYPDIYTFSRQFKRFAGESPSVFARRRGQ